jgi:phospholipid transport system substrate-binding protein
MIDARTALYAALLLSRAISLSQIETLARNGHNQDSCRLLAWQHQGQPLNRSAHLGTFPQNLNTCERVWIARCKTDNSFIQHSSVLTASERRVWDAAQDTGENARPIVIRKIVIVFLASSVVLAAFLCDDVQAAASGGPETIRDFYQELLNAMQNAEVLGREGRYEKLDPVIHRTFDLPHMTRVAVGPTWATLSEERRQELVDAFGRYVTATYADRFDGYAGEKFRVLGEEETGHGRVILTQIVKSNGDPVTINYLMHETDGSWKVADVYLSGTISELASVARRSRRSSETRESAV